MNTSAWRRDTGDKSEVHEQFNAVLNGDGGIIGIIENDSASGLLKDLSWLEFCMILTCMMCTSHSTICSDKYHKQIVSTQKRFATN